MIETWVYPALTAIAVFTGFIDAIAGGGGLIMMPALLSADGRTLAVALTVGLGPPGAGVVAGARRVKNLRRGR